MDESDHNGLTLDHYTFADAAALCEADGDPEHRRRFDFPEDFRPSIEHSQKVIARWERERRAGVRFPFAVRNRTGDLVGGCELARVGDDVANASYWTLPGHRRRGVASEALRLLCTLAFNDFGFRRIEVVADIDNVASWRIALRCGFRECGMREGRMLYVLDYRDSQ
jgi:RimJ/RimL family protein N-acetyltransferase